MTVGHSHDELHQRQQQQQQHHQQQLLFIASVSLSTRACCKEEGNAVVRLLLRSEVKVENPLQTKTTTTTMTSSPSRSATGKIFSWLWSLLACYGIYVISQIAYRIRLRAIEDYGACHFACQVRVYICCWIFI